MARRRKARGQGHELFPGFVDVTEIGVGSLAVVYQAREADTNRLVALKLLNVRDASARAIESFERESVALGALSSHPNIVTLYRTFRTPDGRPVLVLELCHGAVSDRLRGGVGLPVPDAVALGIKIAAALETAHRGGILHRDVKPQNILVTEFGEPALADFGVAMLQSSTQTTAGLFDFTTLHAAPELLEGSGSSAATDVYELASTIYQLVAGQSAFRAYEGESPASVILRILRDPVRPLLGSGVPMQLSDLLIQAMSKEKDDRPPTAEELAHKLADIEAAQGWHRTPMLIRDARPPVAEPVAPTYSIPQAGVPAPAWPSPPPMPAAAPAPVPRPVPPQPRPQPAPVPLPATMAAPTPPAPVYQPVPTPPPTVPERIEFAPPVPVVPQGVESPPAPDAVSPGPAPAPGSVGQAPPAVDDRLWAPQPPAAAPPPADLTVPRRALPSQPPVAPPPAAVPREPAGPPPEPTVPPPMQPDSTVRRPAGFTDPIMPMPPPLGPPDARSTVEIDDADAFGVEPGDAPDERTRARPVAQSWWSTISEPSADQYPIPPSHTDEPEPAPAAAVPTWTQRRPDATMPGGQPQPGPPPPLPRKLKVRSRLSTLRADREQLTLRWALRTMKLPWSDVTGLAPHFDELNPGPQSRGFLVAYTPSGAIELPASRRPRDELQQLHMDLEAIRSGAA